MQKSTILTASIIFLCLGILGLVTTFSTFMMWALVILGIIGLLWGYLDRGNKVK